MTVFLIAVGAAFTAASAFLKLSYTERSYHTHSTPDSDYVVTTYCGEYTVTDVDGFIAVLDQNGVLLKMTDIRIKMLPASDRELLKEGIRVSGREELYEILSDYDA